MQSMELRFPRSLSLDRRIRSRIDTHLVYKKKNTSKISILIYLLLMDFWKQSI